MFVLQQASVGFLRRHPWQLGLALLGIAIGVAVMVAVDLANASSRKAFLLSMDTLNGAATHQIVGGPAGVEESLYAELYLQGDIAELAPVVQGSIEVGDSIMTLLGIDVFAEPNLRDFTVPTVGGTGDDGNAAMDGFNSVARFLTEPGLVLMSRATAARLEIETGQAFTIEAGGTTQQARLLAVLANGRQSATFDNLVVADIATAQEWLKRPGYLSRIDLVLPADLAGSARLQSQLPDGTQLLSAAGRTQSMTEMTAAFMTNLTAMSLLALLVGVFLIYNSVGFAVVQRRGLFGVLRALGVTRRQTFGLILGEAAMLGVVGSVLGLVLGHWLGQQLLLLVSQSINDLYFRVTVTDVATSPWTLLKGGAAGLGATLFAAAIPAWEAAGLQPTLSLKRSVLERRANRAVPLLCVAGLAAVFLSVLVLRFSAANLVAGLVALFLLILGFALCIPLTVSLSSRVLTSFAQRLGGMPARLAVDGVRTSLSRTAVAIVALAVAVSATLGVSIMVDSFRAAVSDWLQTTLQSDLYVGVERGALAPDLIEDISRLDAVEFVSSSRRAWIETAAGRTRVIALSMAPGSYAGTELLEGDPDTVWQAFENEQAVLVSEPYAFRNDVSAGDLLQLETLSGKHRFAIAATYRSYDANQGAVLMSRATYDQFWADRGVDSLGLYLHDAADVDATLERIRELSQGRQALRMSSNRAIRDLSLDIFDRTFIITDVLYWLAVGVAVIGILGAMLALQLERARELAVLRALGMTPRQLATMVVGQTGLIGLLSGLAAIPLGLVMAWVLIDVINRRSFGWQMPISVDPWILATAIGLAVGAALLAGLYPAYKAALSSPAAAMREE